MARVIHRLHWFSFRDQMRRKPWSVLIVDALPNGHVGECCSRRREICLLASQTYTQIAETLGHELLHALCAHVANAQSERDRTDEEYVARVVEASFVPMLASLGAKLPPLPRGTVAMRARMRKAR
jgi:hypothetical protein